MARVLKIPDGPYAVQNMEIVKQAVALLRSDVFDMLGRDVPYGDVSITLEIRDGRITFVKPVVAQRIQTVGR